MLDKENWKDRIKSKVAWYAVIALILFVVKEWVGYDIPKVDVFINLLFTAGIAFGIFNNPTEKHEF